MTTDRQIEKTNSVPTETVSAALEHDGLWLKLLHYPGHYGFEGHLVGHVVDTVVHWEVHRVVLASLRSDVLQTAGAREIVAILVERDGHNSIRGQKGFLDPVPMMTVDVDVEHSLVGLEKLEDSQHAVIDIAEAARLELLGVMQATGPINRDV